MLVLGDTEGEEGRIHYLKHKRNSLVDRSEIKRRERDEMSEKSRK